MVTIGHMVERVSAIGDIDRSFTLSETVSVIVKPRGFASWCRLPYPKHPDGCPNFGIKESCPPLVKYFLDVYKPQVKVAALSFDFDEYLKWRRNAHPDWTERALRNPRHFQGHLDAYLERFTEQLNVPGFVPEYSPEAMGVNLHLTCKRAGINLEWPPTIVMYRIALLAQPIE